MSGLRPNTVAFFTPKLLADGIASGSTPRRMSARSEESRRNNKGLSQNKQNSERFTLTKDRRNGSSAGDRARTE